MPPSIIELLQQRFESQEDAITAARECPEVESLIEHHDRVYQKWTIGWFQGEHRRIAHIFLGDGWVKWVSLDDIAQAIAAPKSCSNCGYFMRGNTGVGIAHLCLAMHQDMDASKCGDWAMPLPDAR